MIRGVLISVAGHVWATCFGSAERGDVVTFRTPARGRW